MSTTPSPVGAIAASLASPGIAPQLSGTPPALGNELLNWLREKLLEGENFLQAQSGYDNIAAAIASVMSQDEAQVFDPRAILSQTRTNRIGKIAEDLAAMLTQTKPFWDYSVNNRRFEQHAAIYGKLATFWYQMRNIDLRLADAIKYYVVSGTGYIHQYWDPDIGDINCCAEDPRNVIPISPVAYDSLESCQGVIVKRTVPVSYIKNRYNLDVEPESDGSATTWVNKMRTAAADVISPIWKFAKAPKTAPELPRIPTVTLYTCYLKDPRQNEDDAPKYMGQWKDGQAQNNWSYKVEKGEPLFPNRRMIMWVANHVIYDGPSYYWHGRFPIIKLTLNPYPWTWLGKAPVWDLLRLQKSLNALLRVIDDHAAQVAQPGSIHDKNSVSRAMYESFDTRRAGWKIYQNPLAGKGIQIQNPPPLDQAIPAQIEWIQKEMKELSGVLDLTSMMNLKQLPSNSTVEAILNTMTPALQFRSRILEAFQREMAMQFAYNVTQFYTLPMRVTMLGAGGVTQDDFDYDPGTLMPDYVHDKDYDSQGNITPVAMLRGPLPRFDRAQEFLRRFVFKIAPGSLLSSAQMEKTLIYFQLARGGMIDPLTLLEQLNIPNIGLERLPDNVRTIIDRMQWCAENGIGLQVNAAGRKASGQQAPVIKVSESG